MLRLGLILLLAFNVFWLTDELQVRSASRANHVVEAPGEPALTSRTIAILTPIPVDPPTATPTAEPAAEPPVEAEVAFVPEDTPTPTTTPSPTPSPTMTATPTASPTITPSATPTDAAYLDRAVVTARSTRPPALAQAAQQPRPTATRAPTRTPTPRPRPTATPRPVVSGANARAADLARSKVGSRYAWGAIGPYSFDCSGLTYWAYRQVGKYIGRTVEVQAGVGARVARSALVKGDLVIFQCTDHCGPSHVGIYLGGGAFVHAQNYSTGVVVSSLGSSYYSSRWYTARRP